MANYIIPIILIILFIFCFVKNVNAYDHFIHGARDAVDLCINTFPYLVAIFAAVELFKLSGLSTTVATFVGPAFKFLGIPSELVDFMVIRPFSGSGSMAILSDLYAEYGVDSYISRCACVAYGASETIFYVGAVYFAGLKRKKLNTALYIAVTAYLSACVFTCFLCRII